MLLLFIVLFIIFSIIIISQMEILYDAWSTLLFNDTWEASSTPPYTNLYRHIYIYLSLLAWPVFNNNTCKTAFIALAPRANEPTCDEFLSPFTVHMRDSRDSETLCVTSCSLSLSLPSLFLSSLLLSLHYIPMREIYRVLSSN